VKNKSKQKAVKIQTSFTAENLTNYSGIDVISKFMVKLVLPDLFKTISLTLGANTKYQTCNILSMIVVGLLSGMNRIVKMEKFSRDPLVRKLFGIKEKIDEDTLANRLKRFGMRQTEELLEIISIASNKVHTQLGTSSDILDMDSTVRMTYGNQEGSTKGYNPKKHGANSYHPLMCFLNSTKECLLSWLRPGNAYTSNNAAEFMKQAFSYLPSTIQNLLVRCDSGFFDGNLLSVIESRPNTEYIIKVKLKNFMEILTGRDWETIPGDSSIQTTEFQYQAQVWNVDRKFVVIRKITSIETEGMLYEKRNYDYFCYVTNIYDSPLQIHSMYGDRGESENWIEAVKNQMFAGSLLTQKFWTNETLWLLSVIAYNVSVWMRKLSDNKTWQEEPMTFRMWFIQIAGKVIESGRRVWLKMSKSYYYKERWLSIEKMIDGLIFL
jgi:hypothetical protein